MRMARLPKWPMSAYSASAPVTASNTEPSTTNEAWPCPVAKASAWSGSSASRIAGFFVVFQAEPGDADGALAEVAHVGVQRLRAGYREQYRAEHHERGVAVSGSEGERVARVERIED